MDIDNTNIFGFLLEDAVLIGSIKTDSSQANSVFYAELILKDFGRLKFSLEDSGNSFSESLIQKLQDAELGENLGDIFELTGYYCLGNYAIDKQYPEANSKTDCFFMTGVATTASMSSNYSANIDSITVHWP